MKTKQMPVKLGTAAALIIFVVSIFTVAGASVYGETAGIIEPADTEKITTRTERLKKRKDEYKTLLTEEYKKKLELKCAAAQKAVVSLKDRDIKVRDKYQSAYLKMAGRLNEVVSKMKQQGLSTANLQNTQQQLTDAVNAYLANAESYRASINDLVALGCDKEAEGWITTLEAARSQRKTLAENAAVVKQAASEVKKALAAAKMSLEAAN